MKRKQMTPTTLYIEGIRYNPEIDEDEVCIKTYCTKCFSETIVPK